MVTSSLATQQATKRVREETCLESSHQPRGSWTPGAPGSVPHVLMQRTWRNGSDGRQRSRRPAVAATMLPAGFATWTPVIGFRNTVFTETFRSEMLQYEVYQCAVLATFSQELGKSESQWLFAVSSVGNHTSSWVVSGVVISAVNVNTAPPITLTVTLSIPDQGRVENVTVTHMKASLIYLYIYGSYAFMCVWSFRLSECEKMIWVIMMTVGGIIPVAYACVLLRRIRPVV